VSPAERETVAAWIAAAPENEEKMAEMAGLLAMVEADEMAGSSGVMPSARAIIDQAREREAAEPPSWLRRYGIGLAAAAVLGLAVGVAAIKRNDHDFVFAPGQFVTGPAETATVQLGDGSVLRLGASSRLQVNGSTTERVVHLEGRAYFAVAKMSRHPFEVRTSAGAATVLGTQFELQASGDHLALLVVQGRVALSAQGRQTTVGAGEMGEIQGGRFAPLVRVTDVGQRLAWTGNFLVFQGAPVTEVAREIASHYRVKVQVADSVLATRTVNAWLSDQSLSQALAVVCTIVDADCAVRDSTVTMRSR
jgi:transmembrane sensor